MLLRIDDLSPLNMDRWMVGYLTVVSWGGLGKGGGGVGRRRMGFGV